MTLGIFSRWNEGELDSYLIENYRRHSKAARSAETDSFLVDHILDTAQQQGTASGPASCAVWASGTASPKRYSRNLSALKDERVARQNSCRAGTLIMASAKN